MQAWLPLQVGQAGANEQSDLGGPLPIEPLASPSEAAELAPVISLDGSAPPDPRSLPLPVASLPESGLLDLPPPETLQPLMAPATQPAGSPAEPLGVADKALPLQLSVPPQAVATGVEAQVAPNLQIPHWLEVISCTPFLPDFLRSRCLRFLRRLACTSIFAVKSAPGFCVTSHSNSGKSSDDKKYFYGISWEEA